MALEYKVCGVCGCLYEDGDIENAFRLVFARYTSQIRRRVCIVCEQRRRDARKAARRLRRKASSCVTNHYRKYKRAGFSGSKQDFIERYSYDLDKMESDLKQVETRHTCPDCERPFRVLDDITLDIREPGEPPIYGKNTEWICRTCNNSKGTMTMAQWEAKKRIFRLWEEFQEKLRKAPWAGLPLFDAMLN